MPVMANSILKQIDIDISGTLKIKEKKIKRGKKNGGKLHKKKRGNGLKNAQYTPGSILPQYDSG